MNDPFREAADAFAETVDLIPLRFLEQLAKTQQRARGVENVMEENPFEGFAALFVADIRKNEERELFIIDPVGCRPDPQIKGIPGFMLYDPALADRFPLGPAGTDGIGRSAQLARFGRATPPLLQCMNAFQHISGPEIAKGFGNVEPDDFRQGVVGMNDAAFLVHNNKQLGNRI